MSGYLNNYWIKPEIISIFHFLRILFIKLEPFLVAVGAGHAPGIDVVGLYVELDILLHLRTLAADSEFGGIIGRKGDKYRAI